LSELGLGYASVFARRDADSTHGAVELLSQSAMFAAEPAGGWIRRDSMQRPERHEVRRWQILIAGAGTLGENELYGRAIIADDRLRASYVGQDTLVLAFDPPGSDINLYAYAFLASPTGVKALRSCSYGTKILRIRKDLLAELPVPLPADSTIARVASLVRTAVEQRERYATSLKAARAVIEELPEMQEAHAMCSDRRARCVKWSGDLPTIGAWNYASTGGALALLRKKWSGRIAEIILEGGLFNGPRFARVECSEPQGIDFFSQRDLFMIRPAPQRIVRPAIPDRLLFVERDCILAGSHGQMSEGSLFGRVELAAFGAWRAGLTQDILRVQPKPQYRELLFAFLSTDVGQRLFKSTAVGTSIPSVRLDLVAALPTPSLETKQAEILKSRLIEAVEARNTASASEAEAVRIIEEEVLPQWLA